MVMPIPAPETLNLWLSQLSVREVQDMIDVVSDHDSMDFRSPGSVNDDTWTWRNDGWLHDVTFEIRCEYDRDMGHSLYHMVMITAEGDRIECFTNEDAYSAMQVLEFVRDNDAIEYSAPRKHYGSW